jgi:low affinity Fe/Cu permease
VLCFFFKKKAAANICAWVVAIVEFARVSKIIKPKKLAAEEAQAKLSDLMVKLEEKMNRLKGLEEALNNMQMEMREKKQEQAKTEAAIEQTQKRFAYDFLLFFCKFSLMYICVY